LLTLLCCFWNSIKQQLKL